MAKKKAPDPGLSDIETFVSRVISSGKNIYVGIDPGADGAIAFLCGNDYCVVDIPTIEVARTRRVAIKGEDGEPVAVGPKTKAVKGKTSKFNLVEILNIFRLLKTVKKRVHVCLEIGLPMSGKGKANNSRTAYMTGCGYAMWPLFLLSKGYASVEEIHPSLWKKIFTLTNKDKEASRQKAMSLFPKAPLARKMDHNRSEALLLAEHLRRSHGTSK